MDEYKKRSKRSPTDKDTRQTSAENPVDAKGAQEETKETEEAHVRTKTPIGRTKKPEPGIARQRKKRESKTIISAKVMGDPSATGIMDKENNGLSSSTPTASDGRRISRRKRNLPPLISSPKHVATASTRITPGITTDAGSATTAETSTGRRQRTRGPSTKHVAAVSTRDTNGTATDAAAATAAPKQNPRGPAKETVIAADAVPGQAVDNDPTVGSDGNHSHHTSTTPEPPQSAHAEPLGSPAPTLRGRSRTPSARRSRATKRTATTRVESPSTPAANANPNRASTTDTTSATAQTTNAHHQASSPAAENPPSNNNTAMISATKPLSVLATRADTHDPIMESPFLRELSKLSAATDDLVTYAPSDEHRALQSAMDKLVDEMFHVHEDIHSAMTDLVSNTYKLRLHHATLPLDEFAARMQGVDGNCATLREKEHILNDLEPTIANQVIHAFYTTFGHLESVRDLELTFNPRASLDHWAEQHRFEPAAAVLKGIRKQFHLRDLQVFKPLQLPDDPVGQAKELQLIDKYAAILLDLKRYYHSDQRLRDHYTNECLRLRDQRELVLNDLTRLYDCIQQSIALEKRIQFDTNHQEWDKIPVGLKSLDALFDKARQYADEVHEDMPSLADIGIAVEIFVQEYELQVDLPQGTTVDEWMNTVKHGTYHKDSWTRDALLTRIQNAAQSKTTEPPKPPTAVLFRTGLQPLNNGSTQWPSFSGINTAASTAGKDPNGSADRVSDHMQHREGVPPRKRRASRTDLFSDQSTLSKGQERSTSAGASETQAPFGTAAADAASSNPPSFGFAATGTQAPFGTAVADAARSNPPSFGFAAGGTQTTFGATAAAGNQAHFGFAAAPAAGTQAPFGSTAATSNGAPPPFQPNTTASGSNPFGPNYATAAGAPPPPPFGTTFAAAPAGPSTFGPATPSSAPGAQTFGARPLHGLYDPSTNTYQSNPGAPPHPSLDQQMLFTTLQRMNENLSETARFMRQSNERATKETKNPGAFDSSAQRAFQSRLDGYFKSQPILQHNYSYHRQLTNLFRAVNLSCLMHPLVPFYECFKLGPIQGAALYKELLAYVRSLDNYQRSSAFNGGLVQYDHYLHVYDPNNGATYVLGSQTQVYLREVIQKEVHDRTAYAPRDSTGYQYDPSDDLTPDQFMKASAAMVQALLSYVQGPPGTNTRPVSSFVTIQQIANDTNLSPPARMCKIMNVLYRDEGADTENFVLFLQNNIKFHSISYGMVNPQHLIRYFNSIVAIVSELVPYDRLPDCLSPSALLQHTFDVLHLLFPGYTAHPNNQWTSLVANYLQYLQNPQLYTPQLACVKDKRIEDLHSLDHCFQLLFNQWQVNAGSCPEQFRPRTLDEWRRLYDAHVKRQTHSSSNHRSRALVHDTSQVPMFQPLLTGGGERNDDANIGDQEIGTELEMDAELELNNEPAPESVETELANALFNKQSRAKREFSQRVKASSSTIHAANNPVITPAWKPKSKPKEKSVGRKDLMPIISHKVSLAKKKLEDTDLTQDQQLEWANTLATEIVQEIAQVHGEAAAKNANAYLLEHIKEMADERMEAAFPPAL